MFRQARNERPRWTTQSLASLLAALTLAIGVIVPVLDAGPGDRVFAFETEHHEGTCVQGHDHTLCTLVASNRALPNDPGPVRLPEPHVLPMSVQAARTTPAVRRIRAHPVRAPPLA